ncbi:hypothetical protein BKA82DRAFT_76652, partial [Pisolithus tinctorius]
LPFIDDVSIKSETTHYQHADGSYETIPENPGIWKFIWNHCIVINHILQHLQNVGATILAKKFILATPFAVIVGHKCTFEAFAPDPPWLSLTSTWLVCSFLGVCSVLHIFIKDFAKIAWPLVTLMQKDVPF